MLRFFLFFLASLILPVTTVWAQQLPSNDASAVGAPSSEETASQKLARSKLMEMANYLSQQKKFSTTMRIGYEVVQANGQKIEFGEIRDLSVQRPNKVRLAEKSSDGRGSVLLFDGLAISLMDGETNLFAQAMQPGDIDHTVVYYVRDLKMRLPLAPLMMTHFPEEMQARIQSIDYVERTSIFGEPAHHIAARTKNVDFQVWIADSQHSLPLRIVLNYRNEEGHPQFWAQFSNWNLNPQFAKKTFEFNPPKGAAQIVFAVQVPSANEADPVSNAPKQGVTQ